MNWPETSTRGNLGDGRFASDTDHPTSREELGQIVASRVETGHAIYPQGGSTALDYGGTPRKPGVAIDLRGLDRVVDYPAADMTITVEAGITLEALRKILEGHGQRLGIEAPDPSRATIGGIYATNTTGPRRFGLGRPRDQIIGVRYVDPQGQEIKGGGRVVKNVAGYDLPKLMTGSMGTLGILTELTLKVRPNPEASALVWVRFRRLIDAAQAIDRLATSGTRPMAIELLNRPAARTIGQNGELPVEDWVVAIGLEDNAASVTWQLDRLTIELGRTDLIECRAEQAEPIWAALAGFQAEGDSPVSILVNLKPSAAMGFLANVDQSLWSVQVHAGNGIIRAHWLGEPELEVVAPEIDRLRTEAARLGGSLTLPRCPTACKDRLLVWGTPRPDWAIAARIKTALDPEGVFNPGRFVGGI